MAIIQSNVSYTRVKLCNMVAYIRNTTTLSIIEHQRVFESDQKFGIAGGKNVHKL